MGGHQRRLNASTSIIRRDIRTLFGITFADQWGHFTDQWMSPIIHSYLDWVEYPKGDHVLEGHTGRVISAVFSSDARYLFSGSANGSIIVWNMEDNTRRHEWIAHPSGVSDLAYHPGLLASAVYGGIQIWNEEKQSDDDDYELIHTLKDLTLKIETVNFNKEGTMLVGGSMGKRVCIWCVKSGRCLEMIDVGSQVKYAGFFKMDGTIKVLTGLLDRSVKIWDPLQSGDIETVSSGTLGTIDDVSVNCDESLIAIICGWGRCTVLTWPDMIIVSEFGTKPNHGHFHPNIPDIIVLDQNHWYTVDIHNVRDGRCLQYFRMHSGFIQDVQFSPNGTHVISVSDDKTVHVWDVSHILLPFQKKKRKIMNK